MTELEKNLQQMNSQLMKQLESMTIQVEKSNEIIEQLTQELSLVREQLAILQRQSFGRKKESLRDEGQLSLFDPDPFTIPEQTGEQSTEEIEVKGHRRKKKRGLKALKLKDLPANEIHHELHEEERCCDWCNEMMNEIGTTTIREEVKFIPAHLEKDVHIQHSYACPNCHKDGADYIKKAPYPKSCMNNSIGSASVIAETIHQKFSLKVPCYRQENEWQRYGLDINRKNMTNWHIRVSEKYFQPLYNRMREILLNQEVLHADETTARVIMSEKEKNYYWLFCSGKYEEQPIVLYHYNESRAGSVVSDFLKGFTGYLHSDAYPAYKKLEASNVFCFAHLRRKFFEAMGKTKNPNGKAVQGFKLCNELFEIERKLKDLSPMDRHNERQKKLKKKLIKFWEWLSSFPVAVHTKLAEAVNYGLNHKEQFMAILKDGRLELSNNRAERLVKEQVMGRKNWLHSFSFRGANSNGVILSLQQSAKANGIDSRKYFEYLLNLLPNVDISKNDVIDAYLPWSPEVQLNCK
jgi:transposase